MADKKISELTPKAATLEDDDLLMISDYNGATYDTKSVTGANIRPYKTVMFNISQSSTSAPTKNFSYETEVTQTFTFARLSTGVYELTSSSSLFTASKTFINISLGSGPNGACVGCYRIDATTIYIVTSDGATASFTDGLLTNATLEIKIIK